jgi:hypothetical protein
MFFFLHLTSTPLAQVFCMGGMQGISLVELVTERVAMVVSTGHREEEKAPPPSLPQCIYIPS